MSNVTLDDLAGFALFKGVPSARMAAVLSAARMAFYKPRTNLLLPGDPAAAVYLVKQGWMKVYHLNEDGKENTARLLGPGQMAMEDYLFSAHPLPVGVKAESDLEVIEIPVAPIRTIVTDEPQAGLNLLHAMMAINQELMHLVEQVTLKTATERVACFLLKVMLEQGHRPLQIFKIPYDKGGAARSLGLTPETFSRSLGLLREDGVEVKSRTVSLADERALCGHCDLHMAHQCGRYTEPGYCRFKAPPKASLLFMMETTAALATLIYG